MSATDRRSGRERRAARRYSVSQEVEWETMSGRRTGTLSDISKYGCFILGSGELNDGETVKVYLPLGEGIKVQFVGEVKNHVYEIGFGLRFFNLSAAHIDVLEKFVAKHR